MRLGLLRHLLLQLLAALLAWFFIAPAVQPQAGPFCRACLPYCCLCLAHAGLAKICPWPVCACGGAVAATGFACLGVLLGLLLTFALGRNALTERVPLYRSGREVADKLALICRRRPGAGGRLW
jgi:hypothetical protein